MVPLLQILASMIIRKSCWRETWSHIAFFLFPMRKFYAPTHRAWSLHHSPDASSPWKLGSTVNGSSQPVIQRFLTALDLLISKGILTSGLPMFWMLHQCCLRPSKVWKTNSTKLIICSRLIALTIKEKQRHNKSCWICFPALRNGKKLSENSQFWA